MVVALVVEVLVLVLLLRYALKQKTGEKFSKKAMVRFILFGLLTGVVLDLLGQVTALNPHMFFSMNPLIAGFLTALLLAAIPEEIIKYVLFRLAVRKNEEIKNVHDMVIVAVIIAFGFSLLEDIQYTVFGSSGAILRALVPGHLLFQVVMGYYYGRAKAEKKPAYHVLSLAAPILIHTLFDMFLLSLMAIVGDDISAVVGTLTAEEIMSMPYYNLMLPLLICALVVLVATLVAIVIVFVNIKRKRESAVMQEAVIYEELPVEEGRS